MTITKLIPDSKNKFSDNLEAQELFRKLDEGIAQYKAGLAIPEEEVYAKIEKKFGFKLENV